MLRAPKDIRENIARAKGYLQRQEVEKALLAMCEALRALADIRLPASVRENLHVRIGEFLRALETHPALRPLLDPGNTGQPRAFKLHVGKEATLATVLNGMARILKREKEDVLQRKSQDRIARKRRLLEEGLAALRHGQTARALAFLRRIVEEFSDEEGIRLQIANILQAAGMPGEAAELYEEDMRLHPRNAAAYTGAVDAWMELGDYARAERIYKSALHVFGGHPSTFGKMAAMYVAWGKMPEAAEAAQHALQEDPTQADALEALAKLTSL